MEFLLTQWEYEYDTKVSNTDNSEASLPRKCESDIIYDTKRTYPAYGKRKRELEQVPPKEPSRIPSPNSITDIKQINEEGVVSVLACLLDSRYITQKLQHLLVGDESKMVLKIKLCGEQLARISRRRDKWPIGAILWFHRLQISKDKSTRLLEGVAMPYGTIKTRIRVLQKLGLSHGKNEALDTSSFARLGYKTEFIEGTLVPKCKRVARWMFKYHSGLLRFQSFRRNSSEGSVIYKDLSTIRHNNLVSIIGRSTSTSLKTSATKLANEIRYYFHLVLLNGDKVIVRLSKGFGMANIVKLVNDVLFQNEFVYCKEFRSGWSFRDDSVLLTACKKSLILNFEQAKNDIDQEIVQALVLNLMKSGKRTFNLEKIKEVLNIKTETNIRVKVPAFIIGCEGFPKASLCCKRCGAVSIMNHGFVECPYQCVVEASELDESSSSNQKFTYSLGLGNIDKDLTPISTEIVSPPPGFEWKMRPILLVLADEIPEPDQSQLEHGVLKVLVKGKCFNEILCVSKQACEQIEP